MVDGFSDGVFLVGHDHAKRKRTMVDVAQLVEPRIVIPAVVGSSPIVHPKFFLFDLAKRKAVESGSERCERQLSLSIKDLS